MKKEINDKNKTINLLNKKISELKQSSNENINQTQEQVEQLIIERDELLRKNENLTKGVIQFNDKIKEVNLIYNNKKENFNKIISIYKEKIKYYKNKIEFLKKKNDDLKLIIKKINSKKDIYDVNTYNSKDNRLSRRNYGFTSNRDFRKQITTPSIKGNENENILYTYTDKRNDENGNSNTQFNKFQDLFDMSQKKYLKNYKIFLSSLDH